MTIRVFRSHKGEIDEGIRGSHRAAKSQQHGHSKLARDLLGQGSPRSTRSSIPRTLTRFLGGSRSICSTTWRPTASWKSRLQCLDQDQYFGVAKADLYLRARDASFTANFVKGFLGIWVPMLLVTSALA